MLMRWWRKLHGKSTPAFQQQLQAEFMQQKHLQQAYLDDFYRQGDLRVGESQTQPKRDIWIQAQADREPISYLVARSGQGKSRLLEHLILEDILALRGVGVIDQNLDLARSVIMKLVLMRDQAQTHPSLRQFLTQALRYYRFDHPDWAFSLNPLLLQHPSEVFSAVDDIVSIFARQFGTHFSSRQEELLRHCLAVLAVNQSNLMALEPLLLNAPYRQQILSQARSASVDLTQVMRFFDYYTALKESQQRNYVHPLLYKVGHLLSHPLIKQALCSPGKALPFEEILQQGSVAIFNLDSNVFRSYTGLLTSFIPTGYKWAARSMGHLPLSQRQPYFLYFDEFQTAISLNEDEFLYFCEVIRKFGLRLIISHHYPDQLPAQLLTSIFNNANLCICMGLKDRSSARTLAHQLYSKVPGAQRSLLPGQQSTQGLFSSPEELMETILNLSRGEGLLRVGNQPVIPFLTPHVADPPFSAFLTPQGHSTWEQHESELLQQAGALPRSQVIQALADQELRIQQILQAPSVISSPPAQKGVQNGPQIWT